MNSETQKSPACWTRNNDERCQVVVGEQCEGCINYQVYCIQLSWARRWNQIIRAQEISEASRSALDELDTLDALASSKAVATHSGWVSS